jgi:hypothetical protein
MEGLRGLVKPLLEVGGPAGRRRSSGGGVGQHAMYVPDTGETSEGQAF